MIKPIAIPALLGLAFLAGCGGSSAVPEQSANVSSSVRLVTGSVHRDFYSPSPVARTIELRAGTGSISIPNTIVTTNLVRFQRLVVVREGTRVLNLQIPNPDEGLAFDGTSIRAPISSEGVFLASVVCEAFTTPPAYWNGHFLPNGLRVEIDSRLDPGSDNFPLSSLAELRADPLLGAGNNSQRSGTGTMTTTSTLTFNSAVLRLVAGDGSEVSVNSAGSIFNRRGENVSQSVPWRTVKNSPGSGPLTFADATLRITFRL